MRIRWIFFDLGSTLVDETDCYQKRYGQIAQRALVRADAVEALAASLFAQKQKGDAEAAAHFGVLLPDWPREAERLYPHAARVLADLHTRGYRLGVIANQLPGTEKRLAAWKIRDYFDVVITSAEAGAAKPDAAIFRRALSEAGCAAAEAVMVGDRIDNDIVPAKALGMKTVWIRQGPRRNIFPARSCERPDRTMDSLEEMMTRWDE